MLTHGDLLTTEERIEGRLKLCERLGIPETNGVYDVVCLTEYGFLAEESDPVTAYVVAEAAYRALLISDGTLSKENFQGLGSVHIVMANDLHGYSLRFPLLKFALLSDTIKN